MKLLVLDQFSDRGGAQQQLTELLPAIQERGWQALFGLPGDGEMFRRIRQSGFAAERIACGPYQSGRKSIADAGRFVWQMPRLAEQIRRMAGQIEADLVYCNGPRLLPALPAAIPVVFHAHSCLASGALRRLAGLALQRTGARVIANCEFVADSWRKYIPPDRVSVIYNGVSAAPVAAGRAAPVVASIGRIAPEKGQLEFLAAAEAIHRAIPAARFEIIGAFLFGGPDASPYERAVRERAAGLPVEFRGWMADANSAFASIDLLLVPSGPREATTRVILEAYAAGVPVVAFASGGIPEVIEDGVTGYLATSVGEMARRAIEILGNPAQRANIARRARDCWRERFTLERYRSEMLAFLEQAAACETDRRQPAPGLPRPPASSHIRTA
ncbi:MAG TPA: glycosyltransferase family 4 protein [Bryobacteraceae bacterium]|nr:glycosyltransferase family 4 protein [Bryobacteraceae bacterium]